jgi:hypothetical protein
MSSREVENSRRESPCVDRCANDHTCRYNTASLDADGRHSSVDSAYTVHSHTVCYRGTQDTLPRSQTANGNGEEDIALSKRQASIR